MSSIVVNGDTSGSVTLSAPAVAGTVTVTLPATSGTMLTTASSTGVSGSAISSGTVAEAYGGTGTSTGYYGFKNRIINGAMVIDQRNAGASVTPTTDGQYTVDRMQVYISAASKFSVQRDSTVYPSGFTYSAKITSLAATSLAAGDYYCFVQPIEGFNVADLGFGASGASTVTISFWVRSSLTGTFGGALRNGAANRAYPFTYTISSANTWEQKTVTIAGDTTGTWATGNTQGMAVIFGLGVGTTNSGTAGAWAASGYISATGATSVVGTNGATFYITGVQLEKGSTATSFDYRPYGTELQLCQRYYQKSYAIETVPASVTKLNIVGGAIGLYGVWAGLNSISFAVQMRAAPTFAYYDSAGNASKVSAYLNTGGWTDNLTTLYTIPLANTLSTNAFVMGAYNPPSSTAQNNNTFLHYTASAEL